MRPALILICAAVALAGCSNPEKTGRYLIDPPTPAARVADNLGTAELREVTLPEYASSGEISWQTADGAVRSNPRSLWADKPERAFTQTLARAISDMSGATVIPSPWPLAEPARRQIEVRVEKALAQRDGVYRLSGRYYVSNASAGGANQARSFDITVPLPVAQRAAGSGIGALAGGRSARPVMTPGAIAAAQNAAISRLAAQIAVIGGPGKTIRTATPKLDPLFSGALDPLPPLDPLPEIRIAPAS